MRIDTTPMLVQLPGPSPSSAVIVNQGPGTLYYKSTQFVSSSSNDGSILAGASGAFTSPKWVVCAPLQPANIEVMSAPPASAALVTRAAPNLLDFMGGTLPDGVASNSDIIDTAVAAAAAQGHSTVMLPATPSQWMISRPLPLSVNWVGEARHGTATRVKALAGFVGDGIFDLSDTSQTLRTVEKLSLNCNFVPGLSALAGPRVGASIGIARELQIIQCAPGPCTRLTSGATLGGTVVLAVESTTKFRQGYVCFAGSGTQAIVTAVGASTLTVTGGSGTFAAGVALEQPRYPIEVQPDAVSGSGAMVGWKLDEIHFSNCAHMLKVSVTGGDDIHTNGLRFSTVETALVSTTTTAGVTFPAGTVVSLASVGGLRANGRVVIGGNDVWYTAISGNTLTGAYSTFVGTINSASVVEQYNRPIDAVVDLDGVNMNIGATNYWNVGMSDAFGISGVRAFMRVGANDTHIENLFLEGRLGPTNFTHFVHANQPGLHLSIRGFTPNIVTAASWVALVRTQLGSPMSAGQLKYLRVQDVVLGGAAEVVHGFPIVDVFSAADTESQANRLDFEFDGVDAFNLLGRFGASSTVGTKGAVRVNGLYRGARVDDFVACLTADADWPTLISHYSLATGTPQSTITAARGSTCSVGNNVTGVTSGYGAFHRKVKFGTINTGWIGTFYGSGSPVSSFDAPVGSMYTDDANGTVYRKTATTSAGWTTP